MGATLPTLTHGENSSTQELVLSLNSEIEMSSDVTAAPPQVRRPYQYPPPPGKKYFADNFKLGTKKFSNHNLQDFLFGDSSDLNFLPSEPGPIPFKRAPDNVPLPAVRSVLNLHTDSLRLLDLTKQGLAESLCTLQFEFDSECECQVSVLFSVPLEHSPAFLTADISRDPDLCSDTYFYPAGFKQKFSEPTFQFSFGNLSNDVTFSPSSRTYPIVIKLQADVSVPGSPRRQRQIHTSLLSVEAVSNRYKPLLLKQRLTVDSLTFLLQEIYGLSRPGDCEADAASLGSQTSQQLEPGEECIVCLAEAKDTLILPCRHLTTCAHCASSLKFQSKKCPICRREFTALLRIRPLGKPAVSAPPGSPPPAGTFASEGYRGVSLFQAVHGISRPVPSVPRHLLPAPVRSLALLEEETLSSVPYPASPADTTYSNPSLALPSELAGNQSDV